MGETFPLAEPDAQGRGDLGSEWMAFRVSSKCVATLASMLDNARHGWRKAYLDAQQGIIMLMAPSRAHETTGHGVDRIMGNLCDAAGVPCEGFKSTRLRRPVDPKNTGPEPDCAFHLGRKAVAYRKLAADGASADAGDAFLTENPPDLVVEVEATFLDSAKLSKYHELEIPEVWRTTGDAFERAVTVEMLSMKGEGYARVDESPVLGLNRDAVAALINEPAKNMFPGSPYEAAILSAAKIVRACAVVRGDCFSAVQPGSGRRGRDAGPTP